MKFSGEQIIPDDLENRYLYLEHLARYRYAAQFVSGKIVLDLGCGTGYGAGYLAGQQAKYVIGVDLNREAITYAQSHYQAPNLAFSHSDCLRLALPDGAVEVVVSFEVIEHIVDGPGYLNEIERVLQPGGYFIGSTPNKRLHSADVEISHNPFHVREYFLSDLHQLLATRFDRVRVLGQSPVQGFVINGGQSLRHLLGERPFIPAELLVDPAIRLESVENAKDFVFICRKGEGSGLDHHDCPAECAGLYVSEHDAVQSMAAVQTAKSLTLEINRLTERLTQLENQVRAYERGRFIRLMAGLKRAGRRLGLIFGRKS
jgi:SAM-dependent methyltransferase